MKYRIIGIFLFLFFLTCYIQVPYLESFVFFIELGTIMLLFMKPDPWGSLLFVPLIGQLIMLVALFLPKPGKLLSTGIILAGTFVLANFLWGVLLLSYKIILSTLPYISLSIYYFWLKRRDKKKQLSL